jgi:hypothetical protein
VALSPKLLLAKCHRAFLIRGAFFIARPRFSGIGRNKSARRINNKKWPSEALGVVALLCAAGTSYLSVKSDCSVRIGLFVF